MKNPHPSPLELQVLSVLWEHGECTVRTVLENMPDGRDRAYTTALSVLQTMERKGLVTRKTKSKAHLYRAKRSSKQILGPVIRDWVANVFAGSPEKMLVATLDTVRLTESEKKNVTAALKNHEAKGK